MIDPELGVNIMDLGLIYGVVVDVENHVTIRMTLTTPRCPLHESLTKGGRESIGFSKLEE